MNTELQRAIWEMDLDYLYRTARCMCCCADHTFDGCPARQWYGCRGQGSMTRADVESWVRHYQQNHGMTREEFFG